MGQRIRRVLLSTINYDHPQRGMAKAFGSLFPETREYDYLDRQRRGVKRDELNEELFRYALDFRPDWIWFQLQETDIIDPRTISRLREELPNCVITHWMGDCRETVGAYSAAVSQSVHLSLLSNVGQLELYRAAGAQEVQYCQIGVDWEEDVLGLPDWTPPFKVPDVVFCANYYGTTFPGTADRIAALDALAEAGVWVGIVGRGWPPRFPVVGSCGVKQQYQVWRRAKVALNVNNFNDIERYYSDRQLISMASGTPVVCRYVPGLEVEFETGKECLWYKDIPEMLLHVSQLLKSDSLRCAVGTEGRAAVMTRHTWWHRILGILPAVEKIHASLLRERDDGRQH